MNPYELAWDDYIHRFNAAKPEGKPGEEWGNEKIWEFRFKKLFLPFGIDQCHLACEIGAGSGKYTRKVLDHSDARIICADVSSEFLSILARELKLEIEKERIIPFHLKTEHPGELLTFIANQGMAGKLDFFYSINTMVHIDLQVLIVYWITAALTLKPGGKMVMTLADPTTGRGAQKLLDDIKPYYCQQGLPGLRFAWISKDMVVNLLEKIGFYILKCDHPALKQAKPRDLFVVAELIDLKKAEAHRFYISN